MATYNLGKVVGPQGPQGEKGDTGPAGSSATITIGTVTTGAAGSNASVTNSGTTSAATLNFTIPRGADGAKGEVTTGAAGSNASVTNAGTTSAAKFNFTIPQGAKGDKGDTGATGAAGAAATITVGTVTTGAAGSSASVTNVGTSSAAKFNFTIPQGAKGDKGDKGDTGPAGSTVASDVSYTDTNNAFDSSDNINTVQKAIDKLAEGGVGLPTFTVTVKYRNENNVESQASSTNVLLGANYDVSGTVAPTGYVLNGLASDSDAVSGVVNKDIVVIFNTLTDVWNSTNNTLTGGDGIADKYEVVFRFVGNSYGTVTGTTTKVVSLGNGNTTGTVTPGTDGITLTANTGCQFNGWSEDPTVAKSVTGGTTYTFKKFIHSILILVNQYLQK